MTTQVKQQELRSRDVASSSRFAASQLWVVHSCLLYESQISPWPQAYSHSGANCGCSWLEVYAADLYHPAAAMKICKQIAEPGRDDQR